MIYVAQSVVQRCTYYLLCADWYPKKRHFQKYSNFAFIFFKTAFMNIILMMTVHHSMINDVDHEPFMVYEESFLVFGSKDFPGFVACQRRSLCSGYLIKCMRYFYFKLVSTFLRV